MLKTDLKKFKFDTKKNTPLIAVGLGEVLFDVVDGMANLGGAPANFAFHCAQAGLKAQAVSAVGQDELGARALEELGSLGKGVISNNYKTGTVQAQIDKEGKASYNFAEDCAFDHLSLSDEHRALAKEASLVCFGTLCQRTKQSREAIREFLSLTHNALRIFDVNLRGQYYSQDLVLSSLPFCEVLKLNEDELPIICKMLECDIQSKALYDKLVKVYGLQGLIYTTGESGSEIFWGEEHSISPAYKIKIVDTIGAGDSFSAAFGASILKGQSLAQAHSNANKVSAFVCTKRGAIPQWNCDLKELFQSKNKVFSSKIPHGY